MRFLITSSECFFVVFFHINQVKTYPQTNFRPSSQREVPHQVDCSISFRPVPGDVGTRQNSTALADSEAGGEGCECIPYYLCNNNRSTDVGGGFLTGVGLVSSPPYKPCPCTQATSSPKPNNDGTCTNYLDVCCIPLPQVLSDKDLNDQPSWNDNIPGNSPGNYPPWYNNSSGNLPPWNNNSPGNSPPWNNNSHGNSPPWNNNSPGNSPPWKNNSPGNSPPWNNNSPGYSPPWNNNSPGNSPPWKNNSPGYSPPWNNNSPGNSPPWNNKSPGNFSPWNNKSPGNRPPWNGKIPGNSPSWNSKPTENQSSWNNNSSSRPPTKPQPSDNYPSRKETFPACGRYYSFQNQEGQGDIEQYGDFPWMVAVFGDKIVNGANKRNLLLCGGSLINPDVVLTAAHCIKGKSSLMIRAGKWNHFSAGEETRLSVQERFVHHVKVHEEYYAGALYNDIALLFLETQLEAGPNIGTVCLPEPGHRVNLRDCIVSGWGSKVFGEDENYGKILKKIELSIVPRTFCEEKLRSTRLGRYFHLHESFICAQGKRGQDACTGDGGGPLICPALDESDSYVQVGVVSWGIGCGGDVPGVYVNVSHFRPWIDLETAILSVDERFGH